MEQNRDLKKKPEPTIKTFRILTFSDEAREFLGALSLLRPIKPRDIEQAAVRGARFRALANSVDAVLEGTALLMGEV